MNTKKELFHQAIEAMRADGPDSEAVAASAARLSERLGLDPRAIAAVDQIRSCEDVRNLFPAYRQGNLTEARALLVKAHLSDCGACLRSFREGSKAVDWSAPAPARTPSTARVARHAARPSPAMGWALAFSFALAVASFFVYRTWWMVPPGVRAEVAAIDGSAYLISDSGDRKLAPGEALKEGDRLRTTGASRATIRLSDGSTVEVNERTALEVGARGRDMTVSLDGGDVIVQAAKRTSGHLYVKTPDCRVAVTGTVFTVNAGLKGSRVSVLQGNVQVSHSGIHSMLQPGDQITTSDNLAPEPLEAQVSWSPEREKYIGILAQLALLEHKISQIPLPGPRYSSDLLPRVPADTLLYVSIPNLGDFLTQANQIFHDQLSQSQELQQWWQKGHNNSEKLDAAVEKIHEISTYLGNEAVIVAVKEPTHPGFAVMADVEKSGLADLLKQQAAAEGAADKFIVIDEAALASLAPGPDMHAYALVRPKEVVFSNDVALLKTLNAQLNAGPSGFAGGDFGNQIAAAYDRGAGIILAADLHQMMMVSAQAHMAVHAGGPAAHAVANSGIENLRYLIAEHRESNGAPQNHLNLQFAGSRQRVASWLGAPAPIGSLDFVSSNASVAVAGLTKDPKTIADDLIAMAANRTGSSPFDEANSKLGINLREDLIANLGGDFLVALDGPVLPTPSWKAVIEVNNSNQLQYTLEHLVQAINSQQDNPGVHKVAIDPSDAGGQRFYAVRDVTSGTVAANYTYSGGYMIIAPTRALLMDALKTHESGTSLGRSASFRALLPKDQNENYSAVAYQNLSPVLSPLLQQFSGERADALRQLAADARPTVICAYGQESRIEVASDSRLFGFDFLTLGALIGNKQGHNLVRQ